MLLNAGNHSNRVDLTVPVMILIALFSSTSTLLACALFSQVWQQYCSCIFDTVGRALFCSYIFR